VGSSGEKKSKSGLHAIHEYSTFNGLGGGKKLFGVGNIEPTWERVWNGGDS